jgi:hypothetical protein
MDVTHFSMIGFVYEGEAQSGLSAMAEKQLAACKPRALDETSINCVVRDRSGAELSIGLRKGLDGATSLMTMNLGFVGEGRAKLSISGDSSDPEWRPFEITRAARFAGDEAPLIFDLADPREAAEIRPGSEVTISIAAFSYDPEIYADAKAFAEAQQKDGAKITFAPNYFIPTGMFFEKVGGAMPDDAKRPTPYADFAGTVLKADMRRNTAGGASFWWVLAETYGGATVDVVIDPATIKTEPKPGNIVTGRFWMSGRLVAQP